MTDKVGFNQIQILFPEEPKYNVEGSDSQVVNIKLEPGETVRSEQGVMMHMHPDIKMDISMNPCCGCYAQMSGESCCKNTYTNNNAAPQYIGFTPNFPAKVVPMPLAKGQLIRSKPGGYMAEIGDIGINIKLDCCSKTCCCGGLGCIQQSMIGKSDGLNVAFLAAGGTVMEKVLGDGEKIIIDTQSLVAWDDTVKMEVRMAGGCFTICCAGEGMFNTVMTGPGRVLIQSMSFEKFRRAIAPPMPEEGGDVGSPETENEMTR